MWLKTTVMFAQISYKLAVIKIKHYFISLSICILVRGERNKHFPRKLLSKTFTGTWAKILL